MGCTSAHLAGEDCASTKDVHRVGPYSVLVGVGIRSASCQMKVGRANSIHWLRGHVHKMCRLAIAMQEFKNSRMSTEQPLGACSMAAPTDVDPTPYLNKWVSEWAVLHQRDYGRAHRFLSCMLCHSEPCRRRINGLAHAAVTCDPNDAQ